MKALTRRSSVPFHARHPSLLVLAVTCCFLSLATIAISNPLPLDIEQELEQAGLPPGFSEMQVQAPDQCQVTLSGDSAIVGAYGGSGSLSVQAQGACDLRVSAEGIPWLKVVEHETHGVNVITYTVSANNTPFQRIAGLTVATKIVTITQEGAGKMHEAIYRAK